MIRFKIAIIALATLTLAACHTLKKGALPVAVKAEAPAPVKPTAPPVKPADGIYEPGSEELAAIQVKYKEVTRKMLDEGYKVYTGACTNCHRPKSIYSFSEQSWPHIIDEMSPGAKITPAQQDAVLKYVLAIKATQPK